MVFMEMKVDGAPMPKDDIDPKLSMYKDLLLSGGVNANFYNLYDGKALVTIANHDVASTKDFLLQQPEISKLEYDSQEFYPPKRDEL